MKKVLAFFAGLRPAVYLTVAALIFAAAGFGIYFETMAAFEYPTDRWVIFLSVLALACLVFLAVNGMIVGNQRGTVFIAGAALLSLVLAACLYVIPCLGNIGIYFTVGNMGNVEANAVGVPSCIKGEVLYILSIALTVASGFFRFKREERGE